MTLTRDEARPIAGEADGAPQEDPAGEAPIAAPAPPAGTAVHSTELLRLNGASLANRSPRDWLLPGADEVFRRIYTRTGSVRSEVLAVSSAVPGEGKTTVALGLGVTMAEDFPDRRVLVVETDLQKPVLAKDFDLAPEPGLVDCLLNDDPIELAYRPTLLPNLHLLPAGSAVSNPGRLLRSSSMALAVDAMRSTHDLVILDVPAVQGNSDSVLLTDLADGILFVVRAGVTPSHVVTKAIEDIDAGRLRGLILNETRSAIPGWLRRLLGL